MSSRNHHAAVDPGSSTANLAEIVPGNHQPLLFQQFPDSPQNSLHDGGRVRFILAEAMKLSGKSRAQIADEMTFLSGRKVTERMLNFWTAESRSDHPFPFELARAFCKSAGSDELLRFQAELAGYKVIDAEEQQLLEFGRQSLQRAHAEQFIADFLHRVSRRKS